MTLYHLREHIKRCIKKTPLYQPVIARKKARLAKSNAVLRERGPQIAEDIVSVVKPTGLSFYLTCGSMLGVVRDGKFIDHDDDIDFALEVIDGTEWEVLNKAFFEHGYTLLKEWLIENRVIECCYSCGELTFDVFGFFPKEDDDDTLIMHLFLRYDDMIYDDPEHFSVEYFELPKPGGVVEISAMGVDLPIPDNAEEHLEVFYGPSWRIPDPNWVDIYCKPLEGVRGSLRDHSKGAK